MAGTIYIVGVGFSEAHRAVARKLNIPTCANCANFLTICLFEYELSDNSETNTCSGMGDEIHRPQERSEPI